MKPEATLESILKELGEATPGSETAAALARRFQCERWYRKDRIRAAAWAHSDAGLRRMAREADFLCTIESDLRAEIKAISAGFESSTGEFIHTVVALEHLQRVRLDVPSCSKLPVFIESDAVDEALHQSSFDSFAGWDYFLEYFSVVLKDLTSRSRGDEAHCITPEQVVYATAHFAQSSKWQTFYEFRAFWEAGELEIDLDASLLNAAHSELVHAFRMSLSRVRAFRVSRSNDRLAPDRVHAGTRELPPSAYRSTAELTSCYLTTLQFFSPALKEQVHGATLAEWIRAYHVLRDFAWNTIREQPADTPEMLLVEREQAFFEELLSQEGAIDKRRAQVIVKHMTFGPTSKDILDCPLIPSNGRLMMLPAVTAILEPAHSLESMLHSVRAPKNHELQFTGPGLEWSVRASIQDAGVVARKVVHRNKYDCDVAFVLDNVLFLCECKCKFIAADFSTYADWETYLRTDAVAQHKRTCDFFEQNLHLVRHKLGLRPQWQPKAVERVIITSAKLGRPLRAEGYWITDHHVIHAYFTREPATVRVGARDLFELADERLEGPMTAKGLLDYLNDPQILAIHQGYLKQRHMPIEIGTQRLSFNDCETYGEIQFL